MNRTSSACDWRWRKETFLHQSLIPVYLLRNTTAWNNHTRKNTLFLRPFLTKDRWVKGKESHMLWNKWNIISWTCNAQCTFLKDMLWTSRTQLHGFTMRSLPNVLEWSIHDKQFFLQHIEIKSVPIAKTTAQRRIPWWCIRNIACSVDPLIPNESMKVFVTPTNILDQLQPGDVFRLATYETSKDTFIVRKYHDCFVTKVLHKHSQAKCNRLHLSDRPSSMYLRFSKEHTTNPLTDARSPNARIDLMSRQTSNRRSSVLEKLTRSS